jgi:hypothetical protein
MLDPFTYSAINKLLNKIGKFLLPEARITLVVRQPNDDEADLVLTLDDLDEIKKAIDRTKQRVKTPPRFSREPQ